MKTTVLYLGLLFFFCNSTFGQTDSAAVVLEVDSLIKVSRGLTGQKKFDDAQAIHQVAEAKALQVFGNNSLPFARCRFNQGRIHSQMQCFEDAEPCFVEALLIQEKIEGKKNLEYAGNANSLATLLFQMGRYTEARDRYLEVKSIREKISGKESVDYARCVSNLGAVTNRLAEYQQSEAFYLEAREIFARLSGKNHPDYASVLNNLASLYFDTERLESAEVLYLEAKAIRDRFPDKELSKQASVMHNLGNLYRKIGRYEAAESCLLQAKSLLEKTTGPKHPDYATVLTNLALLYEVSGQDKKAESIYLDTKARLENTNLQKTLQYPSLLLNIASLYERSGRLTEIEPYLLSAQKILEQTVGFENVTYASCINKLARLYRKVGRQEDARALLLQVISIREKINSNTYVEYAYSLSGLADLNKVGGRPDSAIAQQKEARDLLKRMMGANNQAYGNSLCQLACIYGELGQHNNSIATFREFIHWEREQLSKAQYYLPEASLHAYTEYYKNTVDNFFSLGMRAPEVADDAYGSALFYKGFLLKTASQIKRFALADSLSTEKYYRLVASHRLLAREYAKASDEQANIASLETQANTLEKELARSVAGFGQAIRQINWQDVQAALQPGQAALEFVRFKYYNPLPTDSVLYAALLLLPGTKTPAYISLFEEKQLQSLLSSLADQGSEGLNALYGGPAGQTLHRLLWAPLEPQLAGVNTIFFSPAGLLHRLNLSAIPSSKPKQTLGQRYTLHLLGSTRQLAETAAAPAPASTAALFGGIRYDMDSTALAAGKADELANRHRGLSFAQTDSTLRTGSWQYLKYSEQEAANIQTQLKKAGFQAQLHQGYAASEEAFKQLGKDGPSPRILHLSTHGYFFPDPKTSSTTGSPYAAGQEPVFKLSEHPMIRSGLILAGANHAWASGKPLGNREDGILTAYEISQMDLRHTELVVLSACETGLGDIRGNEGVYGLQRAFKIAGAQHLIMSLWQVPDYQTQELMTIFYQKWLTEKQSVQQALKAAQAEMQRRRYEPYYWAGFILVE